jgi:ornithine cyclodeaminase
MFGDEHIGAGFVYLSRADVIAAAADIDIVAVVREALISHARGLSSLPAEGYLGWNTPAGFSARSIAMQGAIPGPAGLTYGLKMINASLGNVDRGLPRSQGLTFIFDAETARPLVMMEAAYISAMRTAAVTVATALATGGSRYRSLALVGCGTLAKAHVTLAERYLPNLEEIRLFDVAETRAQALADAITDRYGAALRVRVGSDARDCVAGADLVVPVTTVTEGYIGRDWITPGALIAHVSLDDLLPEVVQHADRVLVDDWELVSHDHRRLFGRMFREGRLLSPSGERHSGSPTTEMARRVDGSLGELFAGVCPGRSHDTDVIVSNPFGMAVLDVAVGSAVHRVAVDQDRGLKLPV